MFIGEPFLHLQESAAVADRRDPEQFPVLFYRGASNSFYSRLSCAVVGLSIKRNCNHVFVQGGRLHVWDSFSSALWEILFYMVRHRCMFVERLIRFSDLFEIFPLLLWRFFTELPFPEIWISRGSTQCTISLPSNLCSRHKLGRVGSRLCFLILSRLLSVSFPYSTRLLHHLPPPKVLYTKHYDSCCALANTQEKYYIILQTLCFSHTQINDIALK